MNKSTLKCFLKLIDISLICTNLMKVVQYPSQLHIHNAGITFSECLLCPVSLLSGFLPTLSNVNNLSYQKISTKQKHRVCHVNPNTFLLFPKTLWEVPLYLHQEPVETDTKCIWTKEIQDFYTEKKKNKTTLRGQLLLISFCDKDSNEVQAWAAFKKFCWESHGVCLKIKFYDCCYFS